MTSRRAAAPLIAAAALAMSPAARGDARAGGMRAYRAGRFAEALAAFETAARKRPTDPEPLADVALALQKLGRNDDAIAANRKVIELASPPGGGKGQARPTRLAKIRQGAYFTNYQLETAPASASCYRRACERAEKTPWPAVTREEDQHTKELQACYDGLTEIEDTTCVVVYADACTGFVGTYCTTAVDRGKGKPTPDRHRAYEIVVPAATP